MLFQELTRSRCDHDRKPSGYYRSLMRASKTEGDEILCGGDVCP
jgi:hypothetical protein